MPRSSYVSMTTTIFYEESDMAYEVNEYSNNLLDKFHPTKDRLNNLLLRLIMGKDAVEALVTE